MPPSEDFTYRAGWIHKRLLEAVCAAALCVILGLGLWPFHSPRNRVSWLGDQNGLRFGRPGTVIGARALPVGRAAESEASGTVEVWLQPRRVWDSGTFLAFYNPGDPHQFSLHQSLSDFELREGNVKTYLPNAFRKLRPLFLTITAGASGTAFYVDGALVKYSPRLRLQAKDFSGRLILGDSPVQPDSWSGQLFGLAVYGRALTPNQVQLHYQTWTRMGQPAISPDDRNIALYLFDERAGNVVHNCAGTGPDLHIPVKYMVLDKILLEPFWKEFNFSRSYWESVAKNIVGFLPFGFCFYPCLLLRKIRRPAVATVILGFLVSLTIEILQAYLPTRDSGTTDLFTNTLGTWMGVVAFRSLVTLRARNPR